VFFATLAHKGQQIVQETSLIADEIAAGSASAAARLTTNAAQLFKLGGLCSQSSKWQCIPFRWRRRSGEEGGCALGGIVGGMAGAALGGALGTATAAVASIGAWRYLQLSLHLREHSLEPWQSGRGWKIF